MQIRDTFIVRTPTIDAPEPILAARRVFDEAKLASQEAIQAHLLAMEQVKFAPGRDKAATIALIRSGEKVERPVTKYQEETALNLALAEANRERTDQDLARAHGALAEAMREHQEDWEEALDATYNERRTAIMTRLYDALAELDDLSQQLALWQWIRYSNEWNSEYSYGNVGAPKRNDAELQPDINKLRETVKTVFTKLPDEMAPPGSTRYAWGTSEPEGLVAPNVIDSSYV